MEDKDFIINYINWNFIKECDCMKKLIFGCALMLCGIIGGTGWLIASASIIQEGAWSTVLNVFDFGGIECYIILFFYVLAVIGIVVAAKALKEDK